jgi:flagellum-specific ATP synthase
VRAAFVACAVAEFFRDQGADVMLMMDSITRFAQAQRQIGLTVGEQPATKGYTPSVFALMPILLERAGCFITGGSITGLYAVLVEGDDHNEPISDAAKGILDGHVTLSRKLAARGHYPAFSVLESISRVANDVCDRNHVAARQTLVKLLAAHAEVEELINIGAYSRGSNPMTDVAIDMKPAIDAFLQQTTSDQALYPQTCKGLLDLAAMSNAHLAQRTAKSQTPAPTPGSTRRA